MKQSRLQRRVQWRPGDREHNEALAIDVLDSSTCDDLVVALSLVGWQVIPVEGRRRRWALHGAVPAGMAPSWTKPVAVQEAEIAAGMLAEGDARSRANSRRVEAKQPPWKAAGISKATWFRRRALERERDAVSAQ
jgi:hypothetical protein